MATIRKRRQPALLAELEPPSIPEIESAAEAYREIRDRRMACMKPEEEANNKLLALMHEHNLKQYEYDGHEVIVDSKEKAKIRTKKDAEGGESDE